ncbi:MAG: hypothetical protein GKR89_15655 [Candidatus Latescibacteria bacterium]|nr:hypothetical protein [Candidatus Latescibacterota bacterium]
MRIQPLSTYLPRCLFLIALGCLTACGTTKLESKWRDRPVAIDGADDDWSRAKFIIENTPVTMGLLNDDEHLYLSLTTMDRPLQMQIARRGFTVWFDPKGGKSKKYGIRFPLGDPLIGRRDQLAFGGMPGYGRPPGYPSPGGFGDTEDTSLDRTRLQTLFDELLQINELEILVQGAEPYRLLPGQEADLDVEVVYADGRLVYELKIGLSRLDPPLRSPMVKPGADIGMGFETPDIDWRALRRQMAADQSDGFGGGRTDFGDGPAGMGRGRGGYNEYGEDSRRPGESFQLWTKVRLGKSP